MRGPTGDSPLVPSGSVVGSEQAGRGEGAVLFVFIYV